MNSFAKDTQAKYLVGYKRDARRDLFTQQLLLIAQTASITDATLRDSLKDPDPRIQRFLCLPRYGYARVAIRVGNIEGIAATLSERTSKQSSDVTTLIEDLRKNYAIKADLKDPTGTYDVWVANDDDGKACVEAVKKGDAFAVRDYIGKEIALVAAAVAAKSVIDTVWSIMKPVVVGVLQTADAERRAAALRTYFSDDHNVQDLKKNLDDVETFLQKEFQLNRVRKSGEARAAAYTLFDPSARHWKRIVELAGSKDCHDVIQGDLTTSAAAQSCMSAAMNIAAGTLTVALDASDAFDASMDLQLPKEKLSRQVDTLRDIALGKVPDDAKAKALWATVQRYAGLFNTTQSALSSSNEAKIRTAVDQFIGALK